MLGDIDEADKRFREMVEFAAKTPFNVSGVIDAGNQLQALGRYSLDTLTMLGDLASAAGRPMEQALRAYAKLVSGQKGIAIDILNLAGEIIHINEMTSNQNTKKIDVSGFDSGVYLIKLRSETEVVIEKIVIR